MDFHDLIEECEAAEISAGSRAELLIAELYRHGQTPLLTQHAMRLKRLYDAARAKADALGAMLEREECHAN